MIRITDKGSPKPSAKFGSKYGKTPRQRFDESDRKAKEKYECPSCKKKSLKKIGTGIWQCSKCGVKVSGGAYSPNTGAEQILKKALRKDEESEIEIES